MLMHYFNALPALGQYLVLKTRFVICAVRF